jgi:predicted dehydrogenase
MKVALVGAGFIADYHAAALRRLPDTSIVGVVDHDASRAEALGSRWSISVFPTLDALLKVRPDVVHILTPPPVHASAALACLDADCHLFIEKPVTVSSRECDEIVRASARRQRVVGVNQNALYHPAFQQMTRWIRERWLGRVEHVTAWWNVPLPQIQQRQFGHWMFAEPVNILLEQAVHPLSQIVYLLGQPLSCSVVTGDCVPLAADRSFVSTWTATLRCQRGTATCHLSFGRSFSETALHVIGEDGVAYADLRRNLARLSWKTKYIEQTDDLVNGIAAGGRTIHDAVLNFARYCLAFLKLRERSDPFYTGIEDSILAFHAAVRDGRPAPVSLAFGSTLVRACEMMAKAATAVTTVDV